MRIKKSNINFTKPGVIILGFIALVTQIIVLREFLTFFNGNELIIGVILANWMLLTGFGAYIGQLVSKNKRRVTWIYMLLGITGFLPTITVILLHVLWNLYFPPGIMAGINHVFYYSLIILSPFCILSGMLFTLFAKEESIRSKKNKIGHVYAWESVGSLIGGALLNFILIWVLSTFQSLFVIMLLVMILTVVLCIREGQLFTSGILVFMALATSFIFLANNLDEKTRELSYPGQSITYAKNSPYGLIVITQQDGQTNYYENNVLMASSGDVVSKEESVHIGMVQHKSPQNILVLSGIVSGILDEIVKYPVNSIDYVDTNREIIKISEKNLDAVLHAKLKLTESDAFRFLKKNKKKYDIALINLPKPSTIQLNRYYTQEFFQLLKKNLNDDAVISVSVSSSANYMSDEARDFLSIIYKTLKSEFENVLILPVSEDFLLASDGKLTYKIAENIAKKNIPTEYVNAFYFEDELLQFRSQQLMNQLDSSVSINKNFDPVLYQSQIKLWMSRFNFKYWFPALLIMFFSGFFFIRADVINKGVFAAGLAGTSIEIILMLVFQIVFGYMYVVAGVFIMIFMGGLAYGSYYLPEFFKDVNKRLFNKLQIGVSLFALVLPAAFMLLKNNEIPEILLVILFIVLILIPSILTGAIFSVASKISKSDYGAIASKAYGLDLLGAATGALLFTIYLIPILGFAWCVIAVGIFNLLVALIKK